MRRASHAAGARNAAARSARASQVTRKAAMARRLKRNPPQNPQRSPRKNPRTWKSLASTAGAPMASRVAVARNAAARSARASRRMLKAATARSLQPDPQGTLRRRRNLLNQASELLARLLNSVAEGISLYLLLNRSGNGLAAVTMAPVLTCTERQCRPIYLQFCTLLWF